MKKIYDWAVNLIQSSGTDYLFNKQEATRLLQEHVDNKKDNSHKIWTILMVMIWHQTYVKELFDVEKAFNTQHKKQPVFQ